MGKRLFDITVASILLVILAPLIGILMVYVKSVSVGPAIFRQRRTGYHGKAFTIYKIRTMHVNANSWPDVIHENDVRLLPGASYFRSIQVDELPQLVNVIRGDMTFVGPRPMSVLRERALKQMVPGFTDRYEVMPGITGLGQLWDRRKRYLIGAEACHRIDMLYIRKRSLPLDLLILIRTVPVVFKRLGA